MWKPFETVSLHASWIYMISVHTKSLKSSIVLVTTCRLGNCCWANVRQVSSTETLHRYAIHQIRMYLMSLPYTNTMAIFMVYRG